RSAATTATPSRSRRRATASPMPLAAPVTTARRAPFRPAIVSSTAARSFHAAGAISSRCRRRLVRPQPAGGGRDALDRPAAVDHDRLPRHVRGVVAREEADDARDLRRRREPVQRHALEHPLLALGAVVERLLDEL